MLARSMQLPTSRAEYPALIRGIEAVSVDQRLAALRWLARNDLWFLVRYLCNRIDMEATERMGDWVFARSREVQFDSDSHLDLWARGHMKSSLITFGLTIQDLLRGHGDPEQHPLLPVKVREPTIVIFSHTRGIAKAFLRQIKAEFAGNDLLKQCFPDVLWDKPERDAPKWSDDDGLVLKRRGNPKESSLEAWGIVDSQPVSKHFDIMVYDDVVTLSSVATPEMVAKTNEAWEMSLNLGSIEPIKRYIGTRYAFNDTWRHIMQRAQPTVRLHPATDDGTPAGEPVMLSKEQFATRWREMGPYVGAAQLLQNPTADAIAGFKRDWLRSFDVGNTYQHLNRYLMVDPASEKKSGSDFTAIAVVGLGPDKNIYLLDAVRDRLNLKERTTQVMNLHQKWQPRAVGYEKYGMQADIEYLKELQRQQNYRFDITALGGQTPKADRIRRLIPYCAENRLYLPTDLYRTCYDGRTYDLVRQLIEEEMLAFPVGVHDDLLDAIARLFDLPTLWPKGAMVKDELASRREDRYKRKRGGTWMSR